MRRPLRDFSSSSWRHYRSRWFASVARRMAIAFPVVACSTGGMSGERSGASGNAGDGPNNGGGGGSIVVVGGTGQAGGSGNAGAGGEAPEYCGDGLINRAGEVCDDGNARSGDGCTAECSQIEANHACPTPGRPCVTTVRCGDSVVAGTETCDDGEDETTSAPASGDGCSDTCELEPGFTCPRPGAQCRPLCGDGMTLGRETCDDANADTGD